MSHKCKGAGCTKGWSPTRRCHCSLCGDDFSTPANFDKHQDRKVDPIVCDPTGAGLVLNAKGVWTLPGEEDIGERLKASRANTVR